MKRKNMKKITGFTLIELLAVIVILAIIALISTPIIIGVIEKARRGAFEDSAYGVLDAGKLYFTEKLADDNSFSYTEFNFNGDMKDLKIGGEKPAGGTLLIDSDGTQALAIYDKDKKWCAVKNYNEEKIRMIDNYKKCDKDVAENLIINGYGEYGDNTNFENFIFKEGSFENNLKKAPNYTSTGFIEIDPNQKYVQSINLKGVSLGESSYFGIEEYDVDKNLIAGNISSFVKGTVTTLKQDLKNGDTKVYFEDLSSWVATPHPQYETIYTGFKFWNYKDSTGYMYPPETYTRNTWNKIFDVSTIDKGQNTLTLKTPWKYGTYPKGTSVSQSSDGAAYNYGLATLTSLPSNWTQFNNHIQGISTEGNSDEPKKFRPGTKYIRLLALIINNGNEVSSFSLKNISFKKDI